MVNFQTQKIEWTKLIISKVVYYALWIVLPVSVINISWWKVVIAFLLMHYVAGIILSFVFQLAHIVPNVETPMPDDEGNMKNTWAIHQLYTTANFAPKNTIVNFFTGGLNHQVEHHIFPHICHIHYDKIAEIVKNTTNEFNLPYYEYKTMSRALLEHFKHIGELGKKPQIA